MGHISIICPIFQFINMAVSSRTKQTTKKNTAPSTKKQQTVEQAPVIELPPISMPTPSPAPQEPTLTVGNGLYDFYGKKYNTDSLFKLAWDGFNDHINGLKKGLKYRTEYQNALRQILSGIADNTIVYDKATNEFIDSRQGLENSKDKDINKDYVGIMANYLYGLMDKGEEYQDPNNKYKIKFNGQGAIDSALMKDIYNSDVEDVKTVIDRDQYDKKKKTRPITERSIFLAKLFQPYTTREGWQSKFSDFTDADFNYYSPFFIAAYNALRDKKLDPGDTAALSRLSQKLSWADMLHTGEGYGNAGVSAQAGQAGQGDVVSLPTGQTAQVPQAEQSGYVGQGGSSTPSIQIDQAQFEAWLNTKYPRRQPKDLGSAVTLKGRKYGTWTNNTLLEALSTYSSSDLIRMFQKYMLTKDYQIGYEPKIQKYFSSRGMNISGDFFDKLHSVNAILTAMSKKGILTQVGNKFKGVYHVPGMDKNNVGMVWDSNRGTLRKMNLQDLPYWRDKVLKEYINELGAIQSTKNGGILKAAVGDKMPEINPPVSTSLSIPTTDAQKLADYLLYFANINYGKPREGATYLYGNDEQKKLKDGNFLDAYLPGWVPELSSSARDKEAIGSPTPTIRQAFNKHLDYVKSKNIVKDVQNAYQNWKNVNPNGTYQQFVEYYNKKVQALRDKSLTKFDSKYMDAGWTEFFNDFNELYNSRTSSHEGAGIGKQDNLKDYIASAMFLRNPLAFANEDDYDEYRRGLFDNADNSVSFWVDNEGKLKIYENNNPPADPLTNPTNSNPANPTNPDLEQGDKKPEDKKNSKFSGTKGDDKKQNTKSDFLGLKDKTKNISPLLYDALETGLRIAGNRTNAKNTQQDHIYKDPLEFWNNKRYDWFTRKANAEEGIQMVNKLSTPLTSDPDRAILQKYDAYRLFKKNYQDPSDKADHVTAMEGEKEQTKNSYLSAKDRRDVTWDNKYLNWGIDNTNKSIRAARVTADINSLANLIQMASYYDQIDRQEKKLRKEQAMEDVLQSNYQLAYNDLKDKFRSIPGYENATDSDFLADADFMNAVSDLIRQYKYEVNTQDYSEDPYKDYVPRSYADIVENAFIGKKPKQTEQPLLGKRGGILIPKIKRFKTIK